jgi:hypothetical protein
MSRKDFEILAKCIAEIDDERVKYEAGKAVARACFEINPRFDVKKFYEACGVI